MVLLTARPGISIHALREEGDRGTPQRYPGLHISIHALREEGDRGHPRHGRHPVISIHALTFRRTTKLFYFYPRPPRGGRPHRRSSCPRTTDFYPRPPRGGRRRAVIETAQALKNFYPRPPRGGRPSSPPLKDSSILFLSTPSARRATRHDRQEQAADGISIHALREEGDQASTCRPKSIFIFLSTPSARRATTTGRQKK